jgi:HEAT repeat protein
VRIHAAQALWQVHREAEPVVPALLEGLKEKNVILRRQSATILAQMTPAPQSAVPALQDALHDADIITRFHVALSLCGVPGHVKEAIPVLIMPLKNKAQYAQAIQAVEVLAKAGAEAQEAVPALLGALQAGERRAGQTDRR